MPYGFNEDRSKFDLSELSVAVDASEITEGTLSAENGGTGRSSNTPNSVLVGNGPNPVKNIGSHSGALYSTGDEAVPQFGTLPVPQGGTGKTSHRENAVLLGAGADAVKDTRSRSGALFSTGTDNVPQFGTLPVGQGGTGLISVPKNAILMGNGSNGFRTIAPADGALYYDGQGSPLFGTLPISQGGTGATTADGLNSTIINALVGDSESARANLKALKEALGIPTIGVLTLEEEDLTWAENTIDLTTNVYKKARKLGGFIELRMQGIKNYAEWGVMQQLLFQNVINRLPEDWRRDSPPSISCELTIAGRYAGIVTAYAPTETDGIITYGDSYWTPPYGNNTGISANTQIEVHGYWTVSVSEPEGE